MNWDLLEVHLRCRKAVRMAVVMFLVSTLGAACGSSQSEPADDSGNSEVTTPVDPEPSDRVEPEEYSEAPQLVDEELDAIWASMKELIGPHDLPDAVLAALEVLEKDSTRLLVRASERQVVRLTGSPIGGVVIDPPDDQESARKAIVGLLQTHGAVYEMGEAQGQSLEGNLQTLSADEGSPLRVRLSQFHQGVQVLDGSIRASFGPDGKLDGLAGFLVAEEKLPETVTPVITQEDAIQRAIEAVVTKSQSPPDTEMGGEAWLRVGASQGLVWLVDVWSVDESALEYHAVVSATTGAIQRVHNTMSRLPADPEPVDRVQTTPEARVPIRFYPFKEGMQYEAGDDQKKSHPTTTYSEPVYYERVDDAQCDVALRREGDFQPRIWNDYDRKQDDHVRVLKQRKFRVDCGSSTVASDEKAMIGLSDVFTIDDDEDYAKSSGTSGANDRQFNEQTLYVWAKRIKQHVDSWGRDKAAAGVTSHEYWSTLPHRRVELQIVANAEDDYYCGGTNHGCQFFAQVKSEEDGSGGNYVRFKGAVLKPGDCDGPCTIWRWNAFYGDRYKALAFVSKAAYGTDGWGPNHLGLNKTPTYPNIAHEMGHWIAWTYGHWGFSGEHGEGKAINEAMASAIAAMFGKSFWKDKINYHHSRRVTAGAEINDSCFDAYHPGFESENSKRQWRHHNPDNTADYPLHNYQDICDQEHNEPWVNNSCVTGSYSYRYFLGFPFMQAMWKLMNNHNPAAAEGEQRIWKTTADARRHTADFIMYLLKEETYHRLKDGKLEYSGEGDPTFHDLYLGIEARMIERIARGNESGFIHSSDANECPGGGKCPCTKDADCNSNSCTSPPGSSNKSCATSINRPDSLRRVEKVFADHGLTRSCKAFDKGSAIQDDLVEWIDKKVDQMSATNSNQYEVPTECELKQFREVAKAFLNRDIETARQLAHEVDYKVNSFKDTGNDNEKYWALIPQKKNKEGRGFYFMRYKDNVTRSLFLTAPHIYVDSSTGKVAARTFRSTGARALAINGENRCTNEVDTDCNGTTAVCNTGDESGEENPKYRNSDMAHTVDSFFQVFHEEADSKFGAAVHIQVHGFTPKHEKSTAVSDIDFAISDGSQTERSDADYLPIALAIKLQEQIAATGSGKVGSSCNVDKDDDELGHLHGKQLCASTNTQGRYTNGSSNVCTEAAGSTNGRFIHVELSRDLRNHPCSSGVTGCTNELSPLQFIQAVKQVVPKL